MLNKFFHWLSHLFKTNTGNIVTFEEDGMICIAFECDHCKKIDEKSISKISRNLVIKESELHD